MHDFDTIPQTGDLLLVKHSDPMAIAIDWITTGHREGPTRANHAAVFDSSTSIVSAIAFRKVAGHTKRVVREGWAEYHQQLRLAESEWCIKRRPRDERTDLGKRIIRAVCREMVGDDTNRPWKYSYSAIALQALDGLIAKVFMRGRRGWDVAIFRQFDRIWARGVVCSTTAGRALRKAGFLPDVDRVRFASPDDLDDMTHSRRWPIIAKSPSWPMVHGDIT